MSNRFLFVLGLVFARVVAVHTFLFGGGGGCGCSCPPPPVCAPTPSCGVPVGPVAAPGGCPTSAGGYYSSNYGYTTPVAAGGYYAGPRGGIGTSVVTSEGGYVQTPIAAASKVEGYVTPRNGGRHQEGYHQSSDKDFYDEATPPLDLKAADVSAESKELIPVDVYKRRHQMLKHLKNRRLRQFSVPNIETDPVNPSASVVCNNEKLAKIMAKAIVTDISVSKRLVRRATELAFNGLKFDVICATGDFSYSIYAEQYCETSRGNVTCFAFV